MSVGPPNTSGLETRVADQWPQCERGVCLDPWVRVVVTAACGAEFQPVVQAVQPDVCRGRVWGKINGHARGTRGLTWALGGAELPMAEPIPKVIEIVLSKHYRFMYDNFVIVTQHESYLLLERENDAVSVLHFDSPQLRYGSPNDEARGGHPLANYGLGSYGLFEVFNSPWIRDQMIANRVHHRHTDNLFEGERHFIACFKDVMLEVTCRSYEERTMSVAEVHAIIQKELTNLAGERGSTLRARSRHK